MNRRNTMLNEEHARLLLGRDLLDRDGNPIGKISEVFVDDRTGEPTWVTVKTGWFGLSESFVPLNKVQWSDDRVQAAYDTATVKEAPRFPADQPLTPLDEDALYLHYGLSDAADASDRSQTGSTTGPLGATTGPTTPVPPGSRGRLRRYDAPAERLDAGAAHLGVPAVCPQCGAYVASALLARHDTFHTSVAQPGGFARHDIEVTEPATGATRPEVGYARHDVGITHRATATPTP
jgi:hypothetical protein